MFWVSALRFVGCTAFAPEESVFAAGDDNSMRPTVIVTWIAIHTLIIATESCSCAVSDLERTERPLSRYRERPAAFCCP